MEKTEDEDFKMQGGKNTSNQEISTKKQITWIAEAVWQHSKKHSVVEAKNERKGASV
jgi:hypothetical protein